MMKINRNEFEECIAHIDLCQANWRNGTNVLDLDIHEITIYSIKQENNTTTRLAM